MDVKLTTRRTPSAARLVAAVPLLTAALALAVLPGCDDSSTAVRSYDAPRDVSAPPQPVADVSAPHEDAPLTWTVPEGWKRMPDGQMRYATFQVAADHPDVELSVIPLPLNVNPVLANLNRWEDQLSLPHTPEADLSKVVTTVKVADGTPADAVDLTGKDAKTGQPSRLLGARIPHDEQAWFFKLMGPPDVVATQKANFDAFIRSIHFHSHEATPGGGAGGVASATTDAVPPKLVWDKLPQGWTEEKVTQQFRIATIKVEQGGQVADLAITRIGVSQAGTATDNINRWRASVGLPATSDPSSQPMRQATVAGRDGARVDVKGPEKSVAVAMTDDPATDQLWFFKLTGPTPLVESQSAAFDAFIRTARF